MTTDTTHITKEGLLQAVKELGMRMNNSDLPAGFKRDVISAFVELEKLAAKWRKHGDDVGQFRVYEHGDTVFKRCAKELLAMLDAAPSVSAQESKPVRWLATKVRRKWNAEGTEQTDETYEDRKVIESASEAEFIGSPTMGYTVVPLYAVPSLSAQDASPKDGWQPIETAPKDRQIIGVAPYGSRWSAHHLWFDTQVEEWTDIHSDQYFSPTQYMPLPEPPK